MNTLRGMQEIYVRHEYLFYLFSERKYLLLVQEKIPRG